MEGQMIKKMIMMCAMVMVALASETLEGWKVMRVNIHSEKYLTLFKQWDLDVWSRESVLSLGWNDIRVNQTHIDEVQANGLQHEIMIDNLEGLIQAERASLDLRSAADNWFQSYHTYPEIVSRLQSYASTYPSLITFNASIGKTIQGNSIPSVVITGANGGNKAAIFYSCQQHAREWIASHTCLYVIDQLLAKYATDATVKQLLDNSIIHIVPLVNPDGYLYTWTSSSARLWRKNRRQNSGGTYGVDLNRNWDDHWGGEGSSPSPSSDTYHGTKAFSEPETTAVKNYVLANGPFDAAIDWHCYSQLILRPYGWTDNLPANEKEAKALGDGMRDKIYAVHKVAYTSEASWELYYTTGSAQDWYFGEADIPLSYTIELRDTGRYGFVLPASQIVPTGEENFAAVKYFITYVISATV